MSDRPAIHPTAGPRRLVAIRAEVSPHRPARIPLTAPTRRRTRDRKSTRLNSSHVAISYAVFCLKKKKKKYTHQLKRQDNREKNLDKSEENKRTHINRSTGR